METTEILKNWKTEIKTKSQARGIGIDFQNFVSNQNLSYGELAIYQNHLYNMAKKFGLVREFKENCLI